MAQGVHSCHSRCMKLHLQAGWPWPGKAQGQVPACRVVLAQDICPRRGRRGEGRDMEMSAAMPCPSGCRTPPRLLFSETFTNGTTPSTVGKLENPETTHHGGAVHVEMRPEFQKRRLRVQKPNATRREMICGLIRGGAAKPEDHRFCHDTR